MNVSISTNMFTPDTALALARSSQLAYKNSTDFSASLSSTAETADMAQKPVLGQKTPLEEEKTKDFKDMLYEKAVSGYPPANQNGTKTEDEKTNSKISSENSASAELNNSLLAAVMPTGQQQQTNQIVQFQKAQGTKQTDYEIAVEKGQDVGKNVLPQNYLSADTEKVVLENNSIPAQNKQGNFTENFTQQPETGENSDALVGNDENIAEPGLNNTEISGKPLISENVISEKTNASQDVITSVNSAPKDNISAPQPGTPVEQKNGAENSDGLATNADKPTIQIASPVEQKNGAENIGGSATNADKPTVQTASPVEQKNGAENIDGSATNADKPTAQTASPIEQKNGAENIDGLATNADKPTVQIASPVERKNGAGNPGSNTITEKTGIISQVLEKAEQANEYQSGNVLLKNLNSDNFTKSESNANGNNQLSSQSNSDANFEGILNANDVGYATKQIDNVSDLQTGAGDEINTTKNVGIQVRESIQNSINDGVNEITIRLNPPELGKVYIKFEQQDNQITGLLEVSKAETRVEIQQALPEIIRNLQDSGIQLRRLEVVMSDSSQTEQKPNQDNWLTAGQDDSSGQNSSTGGENQDNRGFYDWLNDSNAYTSINDSKEMLATNTSINLLI